MVYVDWKESMISLLNCHLFREPDRQRIVIVPEIYLRMGTLDENSAFAKEQEYE